MTAATVRNLETLPVRNLNMKTILLLTCVITVLTTTGCFFPGRGGGRGWHDRGELNVAPSAVAVRASQAIEEPPAVEVPNQEFVVLQF